MSDILLTVMRLADMTRVHPDQIEAKCSRCGEVVAVYPSGQRVMEQHGKRVALVCQICHDPMPGAPLAPGALHEPGQSVRKQ